MVLIKDRVNHANKNLRYVDAEGVIRARGEISGTAATAATAAASESRTGLVDRERPVVALLLSLPSFEIPRPECFFKICLEIDKFAFGNEGHT